MIRAALAALALVTALPARADPRWTSADTAWEAGVWAALTLDAVQTVSVGRARDEMNPLLGRCPSAARVGTYFALAALLHAGVAALLPPGKARRMWQGVVLTVELPIIASNTSLGYRWSF